MSNTYHVLWLDGVTGEAITETTVVDGFTITAGQANGDFGPNANGGGLYCNGNGSECSPTIVNVIFGGNLVDSYGGGMYNDARNGGVSNPTLTYVVFHGNRAHLGGGMYNRGYSGTSSPTLTNVVFRGNQASYAGGGMSSDGNGSGSESNPVLTNVLFGGNQSARGGGMYNYGAWSGSGAIDLTGLQKPVRSVSNFFDPYSLSQYTGGMSHMEMVVKSCHDPWLTTKDKSAAPCWIVIQHKLNSVFWSRIVRRIVLSLILALTVLSGLGIEAGAQGETLTLQVEAGFDGYYRSNTWMPVHVVAANEGADIDGAIVIRLDDQGKTITYRQPAALPTHSRKRFTLQIPATYSTRQVEVLLVEGERTLAKETVRTQPIGDDDLFYGILSDDRSALFSLAALPVSGNRRVQVSHLDPYDLPDTGRALTGLDMIVAHSLDTSGLNDEQRSALYGWVAMGGHLVICGGPNAQATAAGLGDLLPVTIEGSETTTDVAPLGDYAGVPWLAQVPAVVTRVSAAHEARILAGEPERPLIVRRTVGSGAIDYIALDPDLEPMRTWIGSGDLWLKLTSRSTRLLREGTEMGWHNLISALANLSGVALPSVFLVGGFLFLYVAIVGPLNFVVLKWLDRRALAWITVPALILLFSGVAYTIGYFSRGKRVIVSEVSIVRAQTEGEVAVVDSYVGLYSPARRSYDVHIPDGSLVRAPRFEPYMPAGLSPQDLEVEQGTETVLRDFSMDVGEMRVFGVQSVQRWASLEPALTLTVEQGKYRLQGTITNHSQNPIEDCALLVESQTVRIPDLAPGEPVSIDEEIQSGTFLMPYQLVEELVGDITLNAKDRREQERRREVLYGTVLYGGGSPGQTPQQPGTITLLGWLSESLQPVEVSDIPTAAHTTTLLVAHLAYDSGTGDKLVLPQRSIEWRHTGSGHAYSPYELYQDTVVEEFTFALPAAAQGRTVERLQVHILNTMLEPAYFEVPEVEILDVRSGDWEGLPFAQWGANEKQDPERYVDEQGQIVIRVDTRTIQGVVSVDLSVVLGE